MMELSEKLRRYRADKPDERTMDEFKRHALKLEAALDGFVTEYCDRTGDEDWPVAADEQSCDLVKAAMKALDI